MAKGPNEAKEPKAAEAKEPKGAAGRKAEAAEAKGGGGKAHPGFKAVAAKIQRKYPGEPGAGARIAAAAARNASAKAKKANPRLKRV